MMKVKLTQDRMAMWVVCEAINSQHELVDKMEVDEEGFREIKFSVGGVELNFLNVVHRLKDVFDQAVEEKAQEILTSKYEDLIGEIMDVQQRIESHKEEFKYEWE